MRTNNKAINVFALALLLLPLAAILQQIFKFHEIEPLKGAFEKEAFPVLNDTSWINSSFQNQFEKYTNQNFGYRNGFVRAKNHVSYYLFRQSSNGNILPFQGNNLLGKEYVDAHLGTDFIGTKTIKERLQPLIYFSKKLAEQGKLLVIVLAPDKASYYREVYGLPPDNETDSTNYKAWVACLQAENIKFIDFRKQFLAMKDTVQAPLFPKHGIHWSVFGMRYAMDSIAGFIAQNSTWQMPRMVVDEVKFSQENHPIEHDLEDILNLMFPFQGELLGYQAANIVAKTDTLPKMLVIADSFFWEIYNTSASQYMQDPHYWYYNFEAHQYSTPNMIRDPKHYAFDSIVEVTDVFLMMSTTINLKTFPWAIGARINEQAELSETNP